MRGKEGGGRTESDGQGKLPAHVVVTGGRDEAAGGGVEGEEGGADDGVLVREVVPGCEAVGVEEGALPWGEGGDTDWGVAGAGDVGEGREDDWRWRWGAASVRVRELRTVMLKGRRWSILWGGKTRVQLRGSGIVR